MMRGAKLKTLRSYAIMKKSLEFMAALHHTRSCDVVL